MSVDTGLLLVVERGSRSVDYLTCHVLFVVRDLRADGRQVGRVCRYGAAEVYDAMQRVGGKR